MSGNPIDPLYTGGCGTPINQGGCSGGRTCGDCPKGCGKTWIVADNQWLMGPVGGSACLLDGIDGTHHPTSTCLCDFYVCDDLEHEITGKSARK